MRNPLRYAITLGVAILLLASSLLATPAQAITYPSATAMLQSYYSKINLRDFATAYTYWTKLTQGYKNFVLGYDKTVQVDPYFGDFQQATNTPISGSVPTVLVGTLTDGSFEAYYGCLNVRYTGDSKLNWVIDSAAIYKIGNLYPDAATITSYTLINCFADLKSVKVPVVARSFVNQQNMLISYYRLVNARDYNTAYTYWLHPTPGPKPNGAPATDYRQTLAQFAAGYANTTYVSLYLGDYNQTGGSAGHGYLDGLQPAVLVGQHADGSVVTYYGCYVVGGQQGLPFSQIGIVSGAFKLLGNDVPNAKTIQQYLGIDCTTLSLQL